jgi:predicted RNA-binding protein with PIN domain
MATRYVVDGYNVLHCSSLLRPVARQDFERARAMLVDKVAMLCVNTGRRAMVVFDGRGRRAESAPAGHSAPGVEIVYAPGHLTADAVIERHVYQTPNRLDVVVVSNDRGMRDLCRGMGALVMEADNFLAEARDSRAFIDDAVLNTRQSAPAHLEQRIDPRALRHLQELRKRLRR